MAIPTTSTDRSPRRSRLVGTLALYSATLSVLWVCAGSPPPGPVGGPTTQEGTAAISAVTARAVAEAVDGHRTGRLLWVAACESDSVGVLGVAGTRDSADLLARAVRETRCSAFGPYRTTVDTLETGVRRGTIWRFFEIDPPEPTPCVHVGDSAFRGTQLCADLSRLGTLRGIRLTVEGSAGSRTFSIAPKADAIFLNLSAVDKFVVPYYARIYGPGPALTMRDMLVGRRP